MRRLILGNFGVCVLSMMLAATMISAPAEAAKKRRHAKESESYFKPPAGPTITLGITMTSESLGTAIDDLLKLFEGRDVLNVEIIRRAFQILPKDNAVAAGTATPAPLTSKMQHLFQFNLTIQGNKDDVAAIKKKLDDSRKSLLIEEFSDQGYKR